MSILEVKNVVKKNGKNTVLKNVSFNIDEKGIYALLGKKTSGKDELAQVLAGCSDIDSGEVIYKGISVYSNSKDNRIVKIKIGYVPEDMSFFPEMTVFEILDFVGKLRRVEADKRIRQIKEALDMVDLSSKYEVLIKDLSSSERKRLSLAHALIGNPSLIILEEPTGQISLSDAELIKNIIVMLGDRKVVILLTDKMNLAQEIAKNVGIMSNGALTLWESMDNLKFRFDGDDFLVKAFVSFSSEN